jgi:hypothetical protein
MADFEKAVDKRDFRISEAIAENILKAFYGNKKTAHVLEVCFETSFNNYHLTVSIKDWVTSLSKCLPDYENLELYEKCSEIKKVIDTLKYIGYENTVSSTKQEDS